MKKTIIASLVGAILLFFWQFLSWDLINLHRAAEEYTPKQDSIMAYLNSQFKEDGNYFMPTFPPGTPRDEQEKLMKNSIGKPWIVLSYHKAMDIDMSLTMAHGFLINIVIIGLLCWIISKINFAGAGAIFLVTLLVGLIGFLNITYTYHIWYQTKDLYASLLDTVVSWGLVGLWLGWYMKKK